MTRSWRIISTFIRLYQKWQKKDGEKYPRKVSMTSYTFFKYNNDNDNNRNKVLNGNS